MKKKSNSILGMAFFGPSLVLMTVFLFIPMILTLIYSFTDYFALNPKLTHFIGLERVHIKTASKIIASMITERKTTSSLS